MLSVRYVLAVNRRNPLTRHYCEAEIHSKNRDHALGYIPCLSLNSRPNTLAHTDRAELGLLRAFIYRTCRVISNRTVSPSSLLAMKEQPCFYTCVLAAPDAIYPLRTFAQSSLPCLHRYVETSMALRPWNFLWCNYVLLGE